MSNELVLTVEADGSISRIAGGPLEESVHTGPLCGCGHTHDVGDDEGADGGCSILGHGCDCWDWHP